jgi:acyl-CoA thioester hydrolase
VATTGTPFVTPQALRFCDTDQLGHVNNAVYAVMYEAGRAEMLARIGLLEPAEGHAVVIARLEVDFLREMNWPATVLVESAIHRIGTKSLHVRQRLLVDGVVTSRATSVLAVIDTQTRRAVELLPAWRDGFQQWLVPDFS